MNRKTGKEKTKMEQLVTSGEAAKLLGLTPDAVRAMERRGGIEALKTLTGRRLFLKVDVEKLAERRAKKAVKESAEGV